MRLAAPGDDCVKFARDTPMAKGFVYLAVVLDWFSRRVLSWKHAHDSGSVARDGIGRYLDLHDRRRPHSSLDGRTPDQAYCVHDSMLPIRLAA